MDQPTKEARDHVLAHIFQEDSLSHVLSFWNWTMGLGKVLLESRDTVPDMQEALFRFSRASSENLRSTSEISGEDMDVSKASSCAYTWTCSFLMSGRRLNAPSVCPPDVWNNSREEINDLVGFVDALFERPNFGCARLPGEDWDISQKRRKTLRCLGFPG